MMVLTRRNMALFVRYRDAANDNERARLLADLCADEVKRQVENVSVTHWNDAAERTAEDVAAAFEAAADRLEAS